VAPVSRPSELGVQSPRETPAARGGEPTVAAPQAVPARDIPPWEDLPPEAFVDPREGGGPALADEEIGVAAAPEVRQRTTTAPGAAERPGASVATAAAAASVEPDALFAAGDWRGVIRALGLGGLVRELAQHCEWAGQVDGELELRLSATHRHLLEMNRGAAERLQDQLAAALGRPIRLRIGIGDIAGETPAQRDAAERRVRHAEAVAALERDPFVRELIERFDATLLEPSVKAL
jgi:DNA polymerase-3 subunit gamma/tau